MADPDAPPSEASDEQWGHPVAEPQLTPEDFEQALRRMKRELALTGLRRSLRDPSLDAEQIVSIVRQIMAIQAEDDAAPRKPRRFVLREILQILAGRPS